MIQGEEKKDNIEIKKLYKQDIEDIIPLRISLQKVDFKNNLGIDEDILISRTRLTIFKYFPQADDLSCKVGYITSVFTKEKYRQRGYQKRVFEKCIEFGKEIGIRRFKLSTINPIAMKMYESFGFLDDKNAKKMKM